MPTIMRAARTTENVSKAPWPPPPPVDDVPELGGAGALGGNGGNGRGAFGAGLWVPPPEAELFTVERTVDRVTARATLKLVTPVPVVLVWTSTRRDDVLRTTILPLVRPALFERSISRSRTWPVAAPPREDESASPGATATSIGVGEMMAPVCAGKAGGDNAAVISTEPALTAVVASSGPAADA
jgi:hypothetical protein